MGPVPPQFAYSRDEYFFECNVLLWLKSTGYVLKFSFIIMLKNQCVK